MIRRPRPSPFNLATTVRLGDFEPPQLERLAALYGLRPTVRELSSLRRLVGGHPYLVRLAMYEAAQAGRNLGDVLRLGLFFEEGIFADHLRERRSLLERTAWSDHGRGKNLLDAVVCVLRDPHFPLDVDAAIRLQSAGVVVEERRGVFLPRNQLYKAYFGTL